MARLAKVTGGRYRETFSLALTCHFASIFLRVFNYAIHLLLGPYVFPSCTGPVPGNQLLLAACNSLVWSRTCGCAQVHSCVVPCVFLACPRFCFPWRVGSVSQGDDRTSETMKQARKLPFDL